MSNFEEFIEKNIPYTQKEFTKYGIWVLKMDIDKIDFLKLFELLRFNPTHSFNYLFCLSCVDYLSFIEINYFLRNIDNKPINEIQLKFNLKSQNPEIHTVSHLWETANFNEREMHELFGVKFISHPNLRKLFLPDQFEGYPLLKNFEDSVNIVKL